jgi:hypothetical protein
MRRLGAILLLLSVAPVGAAAQWRFGMELTTTRFRGSAHTNSDSNPPNVRPGDVTMVGLRLDRTIRRMRLGLRVSYAKQGMSFSGKELAIFVKTGGLLFEGSALASFQVVGIGRESSGAIRAEFGPALHLWKTGDELRTRLGALGAAVYEWPVSGRFSGAIRLEGAVSKSWFDASDLPPEYERRATWRYGVGLGLRYRL